MFHFFESVGTCKNVLVFDLSKFFFSVRATKQSFLIVMPLYCLSFIVMVLKIAYEISF